MRGSGKQVLGNILKNLSTKLLNEDELSDATHKLQAGLLVHGSTAFESFEKVSRLIWGSSTDDGEVWRQGIATRNGNYFISDIFESILATPDLKKAIMSEYPKLDASDYEAAMWGIYLVLTSVQMFNELLTVEVKNDNELDLDRWIQSCSKRMQDHLEEQAELEKGSID